MNWQHWDRSRWPTWMMRLRCSASRSEAQIRSPLASNGICGNPVNDLDHSPGGHRGYSETPRGPPSPLPLRRNSIAGWSQDRRARHRLSGFHIRCGPTRSRGCLSQPCPFLAPCRKLPISHGAQRQQMDRDVTAHLAFADSSFDQATADGCRVRRCPMMSRPTQHFRHPAGPATEITARQRIGRPRRTHPVRALHRAVRTSDATKGVCCRAS